MDVTLECVSREKELQRPTEIGRVRLVNVLRVAWFGREKRVDYWLAALLTKDGDVRKLR